MRPADVLRLDAFVWNLPDGEMRELVGVVLETGLTRRYNLRQIVLGYSAERYEGLLPAILGELQSSRRIAER